jgi:hypothetical protein
MYRVKVFLASPMSEPALLLMELVYEKNSPRGNKRPFKVLQCAVEQVILSNQNYFYEY